MIGAVRSYSVPADALLARHCERVAGAYTDCFVTEIAGEVGLAGFVEAFYASPAFKLELFTVGLLFGKAWSDAMARQVALGEGEDFSAWRVEARTADELLMREIISDRTKSWLRVEPAADGPEPRTRLYFGTAILPVGVKANGEPRMSVLFALVPFHRLYARVLLGGARWALMRGRAASWSRLSPG
jgi:hypothetical protein